MDKRQFTSWGVSFGSLALVAGMVSYLGLTNKDTTIKSNRPSQTQAASQSLDQQSPSQNRDDQNSFGNSSNDDGSATFGDGQTTDDNGSSLGDDGSSDNNGQSVFDNGTSGQNDNGLSGGGFGHHRGFDTTTGGS